MIDVEQFIRKLDQDFTFEHPEGRQLKLVWKKKGIKEEYSLNYEGGTVLLNAESPCAAVFGISLAKAATASGHLAEFLGRHKAKFSLRPLWVNSLSKNPVGGDSDMLHRVCQRILLLGYNAVVMEFSFEEIKEQVKNIERAFEVFKGYGVKVIVKPNGISSQIPTFLDDGFGEGLNLCLRSLFDHSEKIDYLFWESTVYDDEVLNHSHARAYLQLDLAKLEIEKLERLLDGKCKLVYSIPTSGSSVAEKQCHWIPKLSHEISSSTAIAFSALEGDACSDHLPPHPLWEKLRTAPHHSHTNYLPLVNIGLVNQGEGLWPTLTLDMIDRFLARCNPANFAGVIVLTAHLPKEGALLSCNLWTASQTLWDNGPPNLLAETWLRAYRPEFLNYKDWRDLLDEIREVSVKIGQLTSYMTEKRKPLTKDEFRTLTDSLLSRLRCLQTQINNKHVHSDTKAGLKDYFVFFVRDARRLILRFLQHYHMPMVNVLEQEDMKESFWTKVSNSNPQRMTSGVDVFLLDQPEKGEPDSLMSQIYEEVVDTEKLSSI